MGCLNSVFVFLGIQIVLTPPTQNDILHVEPCVVAEMDEGPPKLQVKMRKIMNTHMRFCGYSAFTPSLFEN